MKRSAVVIAGPTASGKSALALDAAAALGGEIVNADAMQVYADLSILTARPSPEEMSKAPHHLYGVLDGAERCSAGRWARMAADVIAEIETRGAVPIIVGGTGLYIRALLEGLSEIPPVPEETRQAAAARMDELGPEAFRDEVVARDPEMAWLHVNDTQRLQRAWSVFEATGAPLSYYQAEAGAPLLEGDSVRLVLAPPRETLYQRCDARFDKMLTAGAVEEVRKLLARDLEPDLPILKSLGVPEIAAVLSENMALEEAADLAKTATRQFAKRQMTWFRRQTSDWSRFETADAALTFLLKTAE